MYEVVRAFRDSKNDDHYYGVGDTYPVSGYKPTKTRIAELVTGSNKNGKVYLKMIEDDTTSSTDASQTSTPDGTDASQTSDKDSD